jgi:dTDP-4-amino-4,6-dideoxygalactose transaminase
MSKDDKDIRLPVTKPFVPPLEELQPFLERIMESRMLTNGGPVHDEFEQALCDYLGVKHICLLSSGTLALTLAIKSLNLKGEVITTPFTSVATTQAIYWCNLKPVFADISQSDLNINIDSIERAITASTCAIVPVHVFGNPCNIDEINRLSRQYNLKVIYDAAHCFGVKYNGESICNSGDLSVLSFHATKVFNTIEGGAIICHDEKQKIHLNNLKNTGLDKHHMLDGYGLNAKLNEFQSAFGLVQLRHIDQVIEQRKKAVMLYRKLLSDMKSLSMIAEKDGVKYNYAFLPVLISPAEFGATRDDVMAFLESNNIFPRKYFHPLVSDFKEFNQYKKAELQIATQVAENILCLPLFHDITKDEIFRVVDCLKKFSLQSQALKKL